MSTFDTVHDAAHGGSAGGQLAYVEKTSDTSITATVEASADTVVTAGAIVFDGSTAVIIEFWTPALRAAATAGAILNVWLFDGSSSIGRLAAVENPATSVFTAFPGLMGRRITPSAASHTYSIRSTVSTGTGTVRGGAGGAGTLVPAYIRITRA